MRRPALSGLAPPAVLLAVLVGLCAPVLFARPPLVLSHARTDVAGHFYHVRTFTAQHLQAGEIPFWNPHVFAGMPFVGGFQSALFYPGILLFLALPVETAIDATIVVHLFLAGLFAMLGAARRGAGGAAMFVAGGVVALGGPLFPHLWGGHLTLLCAAPWAVLMLVAVDALLAGAGVVWIAIGAAATGLALLAGHPQTVFHAGVAAVIWTAFRWPSVRGRARVAGALAAAAVLGLAMAAIQVWPAWREAPFGIRGSLPADIAATFSLPPENLVTLLAPGFFGSGSTPPYWGRGYFWEMSIFIGVATLPLVAIGMLRPGGDGRRLAAAALVVLVLALGANTPLFAPLHAVAPGFDRIRGWSKFGFPFAFFLALLAADGIERLRAAAPARRGIAAVAALGVAVLAAGLVAMRGTGGDAAPAAFVRLVSAVQTAAADRGESYLAPAVAENRDFLRHAAERASRQVAAGGAVLVAAAGLLALARRRRDLAATAFAVLVGAELAVAAAPLVTGFDPVPARFENLKSLLASRGGEGRIVNAIMPNSAMTIGAREIGGYDPGVPRRTAEFLEFTQGRSPDEFAQYARIESAPELLALLRFDLAVFLEEGRISALPSVVPPLPRVALFERCQVVADRDAAFARMAEPDFDYRSVVVLESHPDPAPAPGGAEGRAAVVSERTGELVVEASLPAPAILVVTDAYHPFWTAEALPGSAQERYEILPADRMLRAVPLAAGEHRIRFAYRVPGFRAAALVSVLAWVVAAAIAWLAVRRRGAP